MRKITREDYESRIIQVQLYIQRHLDDPLTLEELARVACFSSYHFHRIFRAMVGESVKEYIRRIRLERAAFQLLYTTRQIVAIALNAGYETHESFTRAFRHRFAMSPSEYRMTGPRHASADEKFVLTIRKNQGDFSMDVSVQPCDSILVASARHTGPYAECKKAWDTLCGNPNVCKTFGPDTKFLGMCYDDPDMTDDDKIRYDACVTIGEPQNFGGGVTTQTIDAGRYAIYVQKGSYDCLHDTYRKLYGEWLPASGYELGDGPCLEIYLNCPDTTPPDELLTEIRIPLK